MTKQSLKMQLMWYITQRSLRVFKPQDLASFRNEHQLTYGAVIKLLRALLDNGWLQSIRNGIYKIAAGNTTPIHEFEIAMKLANSAIISHISAFSYHELTDQAIKKVIITTTNTVTAPRQGTKSKKSGFCYQGIEYEFIKIKESAFFGWETRWKGSSQFNVTNLERTLMDGLHLPQYCGGFDEVLHAYQTNLDRIDIKKLIEYALQFSIAVSRRLGWALDYLQVDQNMIECLARKDSPGYRLLVANKKAAGSYDAKWKLQINHF